MKMIKLVLALALVWGGYMWWSKTHAVPGFATASPGDSGFVRMPQPLGTDADQVLIFAPLNCPSDAAQRARTLSRALAAQGIPHARLDTADFDMENPGREMADRFKRVMQGTVPIVFVHGRAKANPTLDEVVAAYGAAEEP